jgi:predicted mannosyl-3-phosphoglycerate phosphatase (HAD superfamily)
MDAITTLLQTLNTLSPLAVIALLGVVIYVLVWKQPTNKDLATIKNNDLHELPEMAETLRRIEIKLSEEFSFIRTRLNSR